MARARLVGGYAAALDAGLRAASAAVSDVGWEALEVGQRATGPERATRAGASDTAGTRHGLYSSRGCTSTVSTGTACAISSGPLLRTLFTSGGTA